MQKLSTVNIKHLLQNVLLLLLISISALAQVPAKIIPGFTFFKLDKTEFTNKNLVQGKQLFFVFFDITCDHCQHAVSEINKHFQELKKTAIYLISLDNQQKMNQFLDKYGQNLKNKNNVTLLQDLNNEFIKKFGPRKYPSLFLYSAKRELILYDDDEKKLTLFLKQIKK